MSDGIADEYVRIYGVKKPNLVMNCPPYIDKVNSKDIFRKNFNIDKKQNIFLYQGGLFNHRGIETILESFQQTQDKIVVFMGNGPLEGIIKQAADKHDNIFYHKAVSPDVLLDYTASADIGIFTCPNSCLSHYYCLSNKLFEYTMAELPVIVSDLHEMKRIIDKYQSGLVIKNNTKALTEVINNITATDIKNYKKNIKAMKKIYCWEQQEKSLLSLYNHNN